MNWICRLGRYLMGGGRSPRVDKRMVNNSNINKKGIRKSAGGMAYHLCNAKQNGQQRHLFMESSDWGHHPKSLGDCGPWDFGLGTCLGTPFTMIPPWLYKIMSHSSTGEMLTFTERAAEYVCLQHIYRYTRFTSAGWMIWKKLLHNSLWGLSVWVALLHMNHEFFLHTLGKSQTVAKCGPSRWSLM